MLANAPLAHWYKIYPVHCPEARKTISDFPAEPVCDVEPLSDFCVQPVSEFYEKLALLDRVQPDFGWINKFATRWPDGKDILDAPRTSGLATRSCAANSNA